MELDVNVVTIVSGVVVAICGIIVPLTTAVLNYKQQSRAAELAAEVAVKVEQVRIDAKTAADQVTQAAVKVEAVRTNLADAKVETDLKLANLQQVAIDTHTLVNNNMGVQLRLGADLSEFKAATTKQPEDIAAAKMARSLYDEHVRKQGMVDRGLDSDGKPTAKPAAPATPAPVAVAGPLQIAVPALSGADLITAIKEAIKEAMTPAPKTV